MENEKKIPSWFIYFFGSFGGILFGYDIGVMTGALPFLKIDWVSSMSNATLVGWVTSGVTFGAIFGGALAGQLADRLGRRRMILYSAVIFCVFSLLSGVAPNNGVFYLIIIRCFLGLAVGAASALVPPYMAELAPARLRGRMNGLNQTMIVSGMLISYIMDYLFKGLPTAWGWRIMLAFAAVPAIVLFFGVLKLPESPRYLVNHGQNDEARKVLSYVRSNDNEIDSELNDIKKTAETEKHAANKSVSYASLFTGKYRYLVIAGVGVAAFQQFQGANAIFYYIPLIVESALKINASDALIWSVLQGVILVVGALLYMVIAEKFKRRTLIMCGGTVMAISFLIPAIVNKITSTEHPMLLLVFLCVYVFFYAFTWAPLTWVIVGEMFPLAVRGKAAGLASSFNWIGSFVVGLLFPIMTASLSQEAVFAIFGVICIFGVLFVKFFVPETKGISLEEIEARNVKE
ncbi:putative metabolite transport protein CsbC [Lentilactobacillus parabuchneri]|jgi:sugar porter (SP) family MFS transporter|uniref:D-arabinose H(+) symporter n=3 Tax=Lentilactobacillus parabuchneri TaxID=152331 RepID=A0A0R1YT10_9LACO|nr:sugar porter family MFS transporter [Lentilactobacillus parabuchneri]APR07492.1 putative metabolite transport protein CsbC [Lentilactobacillus parabuchneri]KRM45664.1 D-arabinose H(+) symporter [Lentilactobacillus parabuchneri DSM 5707 = NBRC 107865]KRN80412.1 D-arabinose H(+) symporter [Lentilactobacillus parabuchneri]MBW0223546.1 sugar porter family MFS transporter [Lentilactobacillus parabuchneri]MBW0246588.1 sugar porter family MFS transporter [Lentilactobacillus parabuchneri]